MQQRAGVEREGGEGRWRGVAAWRLLGEKLTPPVCGTDLTFYGSTSSLPPLSLLSPSSLPPLSMHLHVFGATHNRVCLLRLCVMAATSLPSSRLPDAPSQSDRDKLTIFVSVVSYRDPETLPTLTSLLTNATHPDRIHIGLVWQYHTTADVHLFLPPSAPTSPFFLSDAPAACSWVDLSAAVVAS